MLSTEDVSNYKILLETIIREKLVGKKNIGIALSSGIDSSGLMFALIDMGYKVTAFSFHREGVISTDYKLSKQNCDALGIKFVEVIIPNAVDVNRLVHIMKDHSLKNKAAVECTYTMDFVWSKMQEYKIDIAFSGVGHDNHFGTTKKASIHYSSTLELCQKFRKMSFDHFDFDNTGKWGMGKQPQVWSDLSNEKGIYLAAPAYDKRLYDFFYNIQFKELNTPKQKYVCWQAYDEYVKKTKLGKHTDLQCGDSQIRELFEPLLLDKVLNPNKKTSMLSFWRDWQNRLMNEEPEVKIKERYKNIIIE